MERVFRIVQTSDLHRGSPDRDDWNAQLDDRQRNLGAGTLDHLSVLLPRRATADFRRVCAERSVDLLVFQGDLGFRGDPALMAAGVDYMKGVVDAAGIPAERVRTLVGNHDASWGDDQKFHAVNTFWLASLGREAPLRIEVERIPFETASVFLCSANSCEETGQTDRLPEEIRPFIDELVESHRKVGGRPEAVEGIFRTLDIPSIDTSEIDNEVAAAEFGDKKQGLVVFQAHHGLFSQEIPRIEFCPDLVQAGYLRQVLLDLERPVLYLHGHTHSPTVHVIRDPRKGGSPLITIGCDEFPKAFNIIDITFDEDAPVHVRVTSLSHLNNQMGFHSVWQADIPLLDSGERLKAIDGTSRAIIARLVEVPRRLGELVDIEGIDGDQDALIARLERLRMIGVLSIDREYSDPRGWILRWTG